jgi:hypothetical protein
VGTCNCVRTRNADTAQDPRVRGRDRSGFGGSSLCLRLGMDLELPGSIVSLVVGGAEGLREKKKKKAETRLEH